VNPPLYAVDPGTEQSALVILQDDRVEGTIYRNDDLLSHLGGPYWDGHLVVEQIESYGMPVGREVFETVFWSGRFVEAWRQKVYNGQPWAHGRTWSLLPRKTVKMTLCGSPRAKDANIRQALIDRYGGPAVTRKGGRLAGIKSHCWAALALAVTYQETRCCWNITTWSGTVLITAGMRISY
jgi:hypothetical protein